MQSLPDYIPKKIRNYLQDLIQPTGFDNCDVYAKRLVFDERMVTIYRFFSEIKRPNLLAELIQIAATSCADYEERESRKYSCRKSKYKTFCNKLKNAALLQRQEVPILKDCLLETLVDLAPKGDFDAEKMIRKNLSEIWNSHAKALFPKLDDVLEQLSYRYLECMTVALAQQEGDWDLPKQFRSSKSIFQFLQYEMNEALLRLQRTGLRNITQDKIHEIAATIISVCSGMDYDPKSLARIKQKRAAKALKKK